LIQKSACLHSRRRDERKVEKNGICVFDAVCVGIAFCLYTLYAKERIRCSQVLYRLGTVGYILVLLRKRDLEEGLAGSAGKAVFPVKEDGPDVQRLA